MDPDEAEAVVRRQVEAAMDEAGMTPAERTRLEEVVAADRALRAEREAREQAVVDVVRERQQVFGAAWEQVLRAVASPDDRPPEITWGTPAHRGGR